MNTCLRKIQRILKHLLVLKVFFYLFMSLEYYIRTNIWLNRLLQATWLRDTCNSEHWTSFLCRLKHFILLFLGLDSQAHLHIFKELKVQSISFVPILPCNWHQGWQPLPEGQWRLDCGQVLRCLVRICLSIYWHFNYFLQD